MTPTILIATGIMNAGGTESLIMETLRHRSADVRYVMLIHYDGEAPKAGVFDDEIRNMGVPMYYIRSVGSLGIRGYINEFTRVMAHMSRADILHSHLNASGGVIAMAAKKCGIRYRICHCHADIHFTGSFLYRIKQEMQLKVLKWLIDRNATDMWACSDAAWRRLFMPWRKKVVVDNMIDATLYLPSEDRRAAAKHKFGLEDRMVIGAVGRVAPIKNYEIILRALPAVPDAVFICFGRFSPDNAYCRRLVELAASLDVSDRVVWAGNSNDIAGDIHCIDVFVMPSFTEGFGMAALEAQAAGIPSVLSSGIPSVVDLGLGLVKFINPGNTESWIGAIRDGLSMKAPGQDAILDAFRRKGFNSPEAVRGIENRYIEIIKQ